MTREFYINDRGIQMDLFGASLEAAALGEPVPEDGYHGEYIHDLAAAGRRREPGILDLPDDERLVAFREAGYAHPARRAAAVSSTTFRTHFDVWFSERTLHDERRGRATAWRSCATRATCSTPTARSGCAPPTSATTRTGCWSGPTAS